MSSAAEADQNVCANCGIGEGDDIKLEDCGGCDLVKYCSDKDKCCEEHREQHDDECKNREKELHDRELFTQPDETHLGECPICFLPMPLDPRKSTFKSCCSEIICQGCDYANRKSGGGNRCPFCREPAASGDKQHRKLMMKRVKANDSAALNQLGGICYDKGDYEGALEYFTKAAELGDSEAHYELGIIYEDGIGVEKDEEKAVYYWEKAAIGGHPQARYNLAVIEGRNGNTERDVKHLIIAANFGHEDSMKELWGAFKGGDITKEDLEATLRSHQEDYGLGA